MAGASEAHLRGVCYAIDRHGLRGFRASLAVHCCVSLDQVPAVLADAQHDRHSLPRSRACAISSARCGRSPPRRAPHGLHDRGGSRPALSVIARAVRSVVDDTMAFLPVNDGAFTSCRVRGSMSNGRSRQPRRQVARRRTALVELTTRTCGESRTYRVVPH